MKEKTQFILHFYFCWTRHWAHVRVANGACPRGYLEVIRRLDDVSIFENLQKNYTKASKQFFQRPKAVVDFPRMHTSTLQSQETTEVQIWCWRPSEVFCCCIFYPLLVTVHPGSLNFQAKNWRKMKNSDCTFATQTFILHLIIHQRYYGLINYCTPKCTALFRACLSCTRSVWCSLVLCAKLIFIHSLSLRLSVNEKGQNTARYLCGLSASSNFSHQIVVVRQSSANTVNNNKTTKKNLRPPAQTHFSKKSTLKFKFTLTVPPPLQTTRNP